MQTQDHGVKKETQDSDSSVFRTLQICMRLSESKSINASHKICQLPFPRLQPDKQLTLNNTVCCKFYRVGQKSGATDSWPKFCQI